MAPRIVYETPIDDHDAVLYRPARISETVIDVTGGATDRTLAAIAERYRSDGFAVVRGLFDPASIDAARGSLEEQVLADDPAYDLVYFEGTIREHIDLDEASDRNPGDSPDRDDLALGQTTDRPPDLPSAERARFVRKFAGFVDSVQPLGALAAEAVLLKMLGQLLGDDVRLFQDMAMIKPPGGREKPWHQDHAYFDFDLEVPICGVWIALDEATVDNGCMHVIGGAHTGGPVPHFKRRDWQICDSDIYGRPITAVPMRAGDVMIFDSKLPHGTPINRSELWRWAVQYHYVAVGAVEANEGVRLALFGSEGTGVSC